MDRSETSRAPVLLLGDSEAARAIQTAVSEHVTLTITNEVERARALAATGGFLAILAVEPRTRVLRDAIVIDPNSDAVVIAQTVAVAIRRSIQITHDHQISALGYDEYIELAHYATTRRYLVALLHRHRGSVTEAARGADMKRESLHRLMRRHHLIADDFREH